VRFVRRRLLARLLVLGREMEARLPGFPRRQRVAAGRAIQAGGAYFVVDGNHRVSVTRYRGVAAVDALVTEFV